MTALSIILIAFNLLTIYFCFNLFQKLQQSKKLISTKLFLEDDLKNFYTKLSEDIIEIYTKLQRVDKKGSFASDDEVGFTFKAILRIIEELADRVNALQSIINAEEDTSKKGKEKA